MKSWINRDVASLKQVQSLLGKLNFIAACVKPSRNFVSRLLRWLRSIYRSSSEMHSVPHYVKKDFIWWDRFLPLYNGVSMMEFENWSKPDAIFSSDSCLTGCGGFWNGCYFHAEFPERILEQILHVNWIFVHVFYCCHFKLSLVSMKLLADRQHVHVR